LLYVYPSLEKRSLESGIDQELPFATISMSAIAGSRIEPTNIFNIIISTAEYPHLKNQFTKVLNEINIYGHDLVTALRNSADNCPSKKLADLYNSLATNITSGGNLGEFFDKRSETLLLDYRLERERYTRSSETFIDVYISIVIAAPMILMILLMMIEVSGLGISLAPTTISLIMVLGVAGVNLVFLVFLRLKQPAK
jgi:flagellar protein FlaJ